MAKRESAQNKNAVVKDLQSAMSRRGDYPEAHAFVVAPLRTLTGARSWRGIDPTTNRWERLGNDGVVFPSIDAGVDVPPLPKSEINLWELAFTDREGEILRPSLLIDPSFSEEKAAEAERSTSDETDEPPPRAPQEPGNAFLHLVLDLARSKDRASIAALSAAGESQREASKLAIGLVAHYKEALEQSREARGEIEKQLAETVAVNAQLSNKLAEQMQQGQMHETIRQLFAGKPELLIETGKELLKAVADKMTQK